MTNYGFSFCISKDEKDRIERQTGEPLTRQRLATGRFDRQVAQKIRANRQHPPLVTLTERIVNCGETVYYHYELDFHPDLEPESIDGFGYKRDGIIDKVKRKVKEWRKN